MRKIFPVILLVSLLVSCVSDEERQRIADEQHVQELMQQHYYYKTGDSILLDFVDRGVFTQRGYEVLRTYMDSRIGIWETQFSDLVQLGDSLAKVLDTISTASQVSPFAFDVPESTTWRDFRKPFSKKGYSLCEIMDTYSPQFIKNEKFNGSGCPLKENPDYHRIIPSSIIKKDPEAYRKVDSKSGFVYLYHNHFKQDMYGKIGHGEVELDFFGDSLMALEYYLYNTPDLHVMFVDKYGTPVYNRKDWSCLNGSDSIDVMIWEFSNMRIKYIGYLRKSDFSDAPHSVRVVSTHKRRTKEWKEYEPVLRAKENEDWDRYWAEQKAEESQREEERKAKQDKAFRDAI